MNKYHIIFFVMAAFMLTYAMLSDWLYTHVTAFQILSVIRLS